MTQKKITLHDMTLRDGMHPKRHLMTLEQMKSVAQGLDQAGVPLIEVTHGDGLGGASVNYGFPAHSDEEYLGSVIPLMKQAKVSALLLPGIGTVDHLKMAHGLGVHTIRVQAGHGHGGLFDDGAHEQRRRPGQAGQADGRLWRQLHLRDRLGRLLAARAGQGAHCCGARSLEA